MVTSDSKLVMNIKWFGGIFIQAVLIIILTCVVIHIEKQTNDRFTGCEMDDWIKECRDLNKGKGLLFPDRKNHQN